jgi:hypothetical protein
MRPSVKKDAQGIAVKLLLPAFRRMRLPIHLNGQHPQVVYSQKVLMFNRSMFSLDPDLAINDIEKRSLTMGAD